MNNYLTEEVLKYKFFVYETINIYFSENIEVIKSVIFNNPHNIEKSDRFYAKLLNKFISDGHSPYEILISDNNDIEKMNKRVKILQNSLEIPDLIYYFYNKKNEWQKSVEYNWFFGLYIFLKKLKNEKKNLFLIMKDNFAIIQDTIFTLYNFRKCLLHQRIKNEPKENIDFVLKEIYEIFYDFFSSNDFKIIITKEMNSNRSDKIKEKLRDNIYELILYYARSLYEKMNNIKNTKVELNSNFEKFRLILSNISNNSYFFKVLSPKDFNMLLIDLFHKDTSKFFNLLSILKYKLNQASKKDIYNLFFNLIKKMLKNFL